MRCSRSLVYLLGLSLLGLGLVRCKSASSGNQPNMSAKGGAAGSSASAGTGGRSGSSSGASGGTAGSGTSGTSGTAGNGGMGTSGNGGSSGSGNAGTAGTSGNGGTSTFGYAKIGGGGFITGGQVSRDGTKVFRTDTSGGYLYDDATGSLSQIVPRNLPAGTQVYLNGTGSYEMMISWLHSQTLVAAYNGALYKSTDGGQSFVLLKAGFTFDSNSNAMRTMERHGQLDPQNDQQILFGDQVGLYRSTDGGMTWALASGTPASVAFHGDTAGWSGIAFNPRAALVGGFTSEAIASTGGKFYRTTDGGMTWNDISSGGPGVEPQMAEFDSQGRYFVGLSSGGLYRYASGTWTNTNPPSTQFPFFFLDPTNDQHVIGVSESNFAFVESMDGANTWSSTVNWMRDNQVSVDGIPWHALSPRYYRANLIVDTTRDVIWTPGGNQGLESFPLSALSGSAPYTADMHGLGIENMCINTMVAPPGSNKLHAVVWDEWYAQLDRDNLVYPTMVNPMAGSVTPSWGLDMAKDGSKVLGRWLAGQVGGGMYFGESGTSTDDGVTWTPFPSLPASTQGANDWGYGGELAMSSKDNLVVVSSNTNGLSSSNGQLRMPWYTKDGGVTWKPVTLPTPWTAANVANVHFAYYLNRQILVADASQIGRFYFLVYATDPAFAGVYRTDDGGDTWTRTSALPGAPALWNYNTHIKSPVSGHLWMTAGEEGSGSPVGTGQLWRSTDGGQTFTALPNVLEPINIGFGAPATAGGYPVLYMSGYYNGQPGVWMTADASSMNPTWIHLADAPNDQYSSVNYIEGDPDVPGRVWFATGCAGVQFGEFAGLLP